MIDRIKNSIQQDSNVQVVGVQFGEQIRYHLLDLTHKHNDFEVKSSRTDLLYDELLGHLNKKGALLLAFSGKGILSKKGAKTPDYRSKIVLNVTNTDFYFYEFHQEKEVFISVARRSLIDQQIDRFTEAGHFVVDYSIGPFVASPLIKLVSVNSIDASNVRLQFLEEELVDFSTIKEFNETRIEDITLSHEMVHLFGTALNYYYPSENLEYDGDFLVGPREERTFKKYFELAGAITLGGFFVSLLISYLMLGSYKDKIAENTVSLEMLQETYSKIKKLEGERDDKRAILQESGFFNVNFLSFYVQELTTGLPKSIRLNEFSLFPSEKKIKQSEKINLQSKTITIIGESKSNTNFNNWYKELKKTSWISTIDIVSYKANKESKYDFEIEIVIN